MPIKKRTPKRAEHAITPAAIAAYIADDEMALHSALGLKPFQPSPLEAVGESPWPRGTGGAIYWPLAVELRIKLEAAVQAQKGDD